MQHAGSASSQSPLPDSVKTGLAAIAVAAFLSAVSGAALFAYLTYKLLTWKHRRYARINQYVALLLNLMLADVQQAIGFALSLQWLLEDGIMALTPTCWAQGWILNVGDCAVAFFTLAMALHLFADVVFDRRLSYAPFLSMIIALWTLDYFISTIGVVVHPRDFYMRAGAWCWINEKYMMDRLWCHYIWLIATQATVIVAYTLMFVILWQRVRTFFYSTADTRLRAESAARSITMYPMAYVVCTLPAVIARLKIMAGGTVGYTELTVCGVMMASNGWLDVLLYTVSRRTLIFGPAVTNEQVGGLDTFTIWNQPETLPGKMEVDFDASRFSLAELHLSRPRIDGTQQPSGLETIVELPNKQQGPIATADASLVDEDPMSPPVVPPPAAMSSDGRLNACGSFADFERTCPTLQKLEEE